MVGRFISFEGGEGAGKSSHIALLAERLRQQGTEVVVTREPGGTPGAEDIRGLFVRGEPGRWTAQTDALLVMAARADHVARRVRPALDAGKTVLCDRFVHSTLAYQGEKGLAAEDLLALHRFATGNLWPDQTLWLDAPAEVGLARSAGRAGKSGAGEPAEQRFEKLDIDYHNRVRAAFAAMARNDGRIIRIDATQKMEDVTKAIWQALQR